MWIRLAVPGVGQRLVAWRRFLAAEGLRADDGVLEALANAFPLAPAQIQAAARDAAAWTAGSPEACGDRQRVSAKTLRNVCRARAGHHLERLAERVRTVHGWEDIVLPPDEPRRAPAVLFFDEADALFGRRSEVRDAHDRYANVEVAYLLQRMDSFEGVTILATNLRKNIDHAFLRRVQFSVDFPQPGPALRLRIWHKVWPDRA